ncbi:virulence factor [Pedobacter sp. KBW06]|uniref:AcvB/VirJ family lysyl-phosphatidylglycerol hydrolase n=1 Tax=Pedobacter sp. KBW06 TaxID=2153359 RepID=UPI000F5B2B26|nr:AcvB/VirJ family lysyl-phosphatidylglycerol hydrolase [Pedobacter sp. KBW06]RQO69980.1 virulence factor [Pedobacter sp. KBW06]
MKLFTTISLLLILFRAPAFSNEVIDHVSYGKFGKITVYHPENTPTSVVLFVSGDGGWKDAVVLMAKNMAAEGALVLGIDARHYGYYLSKASAACLYPAADFEELSLSVQKKYKLINYHKPVLMGYSYGAVLIYGTLVQAPPDTFRGAIALGFSPDINLKKPLCRGNGLTLHVLKKGFSYYLESTKSLTAPFIVLNGEKDLTCPFDASAAFLKGMPMTELIPLPKVGHGFLNQADWQPELKTAFQKILAAPTFSEQKSMEHKAMADKQLKPYTGNLPLILIPAAKKSSLPMVFMISGDGGWTGFDQSLAEALAAKGLAVLGLDAQKYFWNAKTPENSSLEIAKAVQHYKEELGKESFILAGYSFGASIVPFVANRLSAELKDDLKAVISLSPDVTADFEIHLIDLLNFGSSKNKYDVIAEIKKIKTADQVSIFGTGEGNSIKNKFIKNGLKVLTIAGDHHFNKDYATIATAFLKQVSE